MAKFVLISLLFSVMIALEADLVFSTTIGLMIEDIEWDDIDKTS